MKSPSIGKTSLGVPQRSYPWLNLCPVSILSIVSSCVLCQTTNYCDPALCPSSGPHIACNGLSSPGPACGSGAFEIKLGSQRQALITNLHNRLRSRIAMGHQNYSMNEFYPPAARMATLVCWKVRRVRARSVWIGASVSGMGSWAGLYCGSKCKTLFVWAWPMPQYEDNEECWTEHWNQDAPQRKRHLRWDIDSRVYPLLVRWICQFKSLAYC